MHYLLIFETENLKVGKYNIYIVHIQIIGLG